MKSPNQKKSSYNIILVQSQTHVLIPLEVFAPTSALPYTPHLLPVSLSQFLSFHFLETILYLPNCNYSKSTNSNQPKQIIDPSKIQPYQTAIPSLQLNITHKLYFTKSFNQALTRYVTTKSPKKLQR